MWTFVGRPPQPYSHTHTHKHALIWPQFNANRVNRQLYFMGFGQALRLIDLDRISSFVLWTLSHRIQTDAKQVQWTNMRCIVYLQHPQNAQKIHRICVNIASSVAKLLCVWSALFKSDSLHSTLEIAIEMKPEKSLSNKQCQCDASFRYTVDLWWFDRVFSDFIHILAWTALFSPIRARWLISIYGFVHMKYAHGCCF